MGIRLNQPNRRKHEDASEHLDGVTHLVNPRRPDADLDPEHEDQGERHYVGRILKVADQALHAKETHDHRKRRGRLH
jgi:hypothetical protein